MCASREERKKTNNKESFHGWPISLQADTVPSTADDEESRLADGAEAAAVPLLLASLEVAPPLGVEAAFSAAGFVSPPDSLCGLGDLSLFSSLDLSLLSSLERPPPPPPPLPGDPAPSSSCVCELGRGPLRRGRGRKGGLLRWPPVWPPRSLWGSPVPPPSLSLASPSSPLWLPSVSLRGRRGLRLK